MSSLDLDGRAAMVSRTWYSDGGAVNCKASNSFGALDLPYDELVSLSSADCICCVCGCSGSCLEHIRQQKRHCNRLSELVAGPAGNALRDLHGSAQRSRVAMTADECSAEMQAHCLAHMPSTSGWTEFV